MIKADASKFAEKTRRGLQIMAERRAKEVSLADKYLAVIKERTPVKTGETRRSWTIHIKRNDINGVAWEISPDGREKIMGYLEFGTPAHIILPRKPGGVLVFEWQGETVFLKHVHNKGTGPLGIVRITQAELSEDARKLTEEMHAKMRTLPR